MVAATTSIGLTETIGSINLEKEEFFEVDCTLDEARDQLIHIFKYKQDDLCDDDSSATHKALSLLTAHPSLAFEEFGVSTDMNFQFLPLSIFIASGANLGVIALLHKINPYAACEKHPVLMIYVSFIFILAVFG